tara:strand:+ start:38 stop:184 length:147 start_codon:yes stop_codon:yes gene_type:complete
MGDETGLECGSSGVGVEEQPKNKQLYSRPIRREQRIFIEHCFAWWIKL